MLKERLEDNILIATLANGHTNPITLDMLRQLADMVQRVNADDGPKGLILNPLDGFVFDDKNARVHQRTRGGKAGPPLSSRVKDKRDPRAVFSANRYRPMQLPNQQLYQRVSERVDL